jgi:hypothetical protein
MLTEDYFTIHSSKGHSRELSSASLSKLASGYLSRATTKVVEDAFPEEIGDIPTLMYALRRTSIDREKVDVLRKFIQEGGEELYYLNDKVSCDHIFSPTRFLTQNLDPGDHVYVPLPSISMAVRLAS